MLLSLTCGSPYRAMIFPMSWIRPTSWNQSGERVFLIQLDFNIWPNINMHKKLLHLEMDFSPERRPAGLDILIRNFTKTTSGMCYCKTQSYLSTLRRRLWPLSPLISHLYQDALCGFPRRSGRHGKSLGSQRQGRIHQQARPGNRCSPSFSCWSDCSSPIPGAEGQRWEVMFSVCVCHLSGSSRSDQILTPKKHVKLNSRINFTRQENLAINDSVLCNWSRIYTFPLVIIEIQNFSIFILSGLLPKRRCLFYYILLILLFYQPSVWQSPAFGTCASACMY